MTSSRGPEHRGLRILGAVAAMALLVGVLSLADPGKVWYSLRRTEISGLAAAAGCALLSTVLRSARLGLLLAPGTLPLARGSLVAAAAQAAAQFVPARLGELALPWLLNRHAGLSRTAGLGTLLAARSLDLAGLGLWLLAGVVLVWGGSRPLTLLLAALMLVPALALAPILEALSRLVCRLGGGAGPGPWSRRLEALNLAVRELKRRPWRTTGAAAATLAMWASVWLMTWWLLAAMGHRWAATTVITGSAVASVSNLLPLNLIANLGTLEAGWTAAFVALGVPLEVAAATGVAAHLWALVFSAVLGAVSWFLLSLRR